MRLFRFIPAALALAALLAGTPACAQQVPVKLCYEDADNYPWLSKGGSGLQNELIAMAAKRSGIAIETYAIPWKRCLYDVENGMAAGAVAASYTEDRAAYAVYPTTAEGKLDLSRRVNYNSYTLYRVVGTTASWDGKQFINLTGSVGAQLGYSVVGDLKKMGIVAEEAMGGAGLTMKKLLAGRNQLAALLTAEGDDLLDDPDFVGKIEKISPPFIEKPYFLMFNKDYYAKNRKTAEDLWAAVAQVRESKEFVALRKARMNR